MPQFSLFPIVSATLMPAMMLASCEEEQRPRPVEPAEEARSIEFSGRSWTVKSTLPEPGGPGPNLFSNSENNVWLDSVDRLHLRIEKRRGHWYAGEVWTEQALGYGEYSFLLEGDVDRINENAVLGLFTWDDAEGENHREIDIELSRWGDPENENSQFVVQPFDREGNLERFETVLSGSVSRFRFDWQAEQVRFLAQRGSADEPDSADVILEWLYTGPDIPSPGDARAHINLWLLNGDAPGDGEPVEVVISEFRHEP